MAEKVTPLGGHDRRKWHSLPSKLTDWSSELFTQERQGVTSQTLTKTFPHDLQLRVGGRKKRAASRCPSSSLWQLQAVALHRHLTGTGKKRHPGCWLCPLVARRKHCRQEKQETNDKNKGYQQSKSGPSDPWWCRPSAVEAATLTSGGKMRWMWHRYLTVTVLT